MRISALICPVTKLHESTLTRRRTKLTSKKFTSPEGLPTLDFWPTFEVVTVSPHWMYEKSHPSAVGTGLGTGDAKA